MRKLTEQDLTALVGTAQKGYLVERARVKGGSYSDSDHYGIALCKHPTAGWVTWQFHLEDEAPSFYWGHYVDTEAAALADYENRS